MAEIVNSTYNHSLKWQEPLTWMRVNIAYMLSEAPALAVEKNEDTGPLREILRKFEVAFEEFSKAETRLFVEARYCERSPLPAAISGLLCPLVAMRFMFDECILALHSEVLRQRTLHPDNSTPLLCHSCGAELLTAHSEVRDAIDLLKQVVESNLA